MDHRRGCTHRYIEKASRGRTATWRASTAKLRDELLNGEVFNTLREAQVLIEEWRRHYNRVRPHSSLGYRSPAPEALANVEGGKTVPMARSQISSGAGAAADLPPDSWIALSWKIPV